MCLVGSPERVFCSLQVKILFIPSLATLGPLLYSYAQFWQSPYILVTIFALLYHSYTFYIVYPNMHFYLPSINYKPSYLPQPSYRKLQLLSHLNLSRASVFLFYLWNTYPILEPFPLDVFAFSPMHHGGSTTLNQWNKTNCTEVVAIQYCWNYSVITTSATLFATTSHYKWTIYWTMNMNIYEQYIL